MKGDTIKRLIKAANTHPTRGGQAFSLEITMEDGFAYDVTVEEHATYTRDLYGQDYTTDQPICLSTRHITSATINWW